MFVGTIAHFVALAGVLVGLTIIVNSAIPDFKVTRESTLQEQRQFKVGRALIFLILAGLFVFATWATSL